ncbi:hypothetical protein, partial [Avibacterium paragallinarum]|uniref:hypothetical protein n=1 Tax=Avibacterium paragallinarum TaxID=728 RepID=UPI00300EC920
LFCLRSLSVYSLKISFIDKEEYFCCGIFSIINRNLCFCQNYFYTKEKGIKKIYRKKGGDLYLKIEIYN